MFRISRRRLLRSVKDAVIVPCVSLRRESGRQQQCECRIQP